MASIVDSIRTIAGSKNSFFKILLISVILSYPLYQVLTVQFKGFGDIWVIASIIAGIFSIGYVILTARNIIHEEFNIFPSYINIFKIFISGIGGVIVIAPVGYLMYYTNMVLSNIFVQKELPQQVMFLSIGVAELLLVGVLAVQIMLYANKLNPLNAFNLLKILKTFTDFAVNGITLVVGLALIVLIIMGPLGYLAYMMFGPGLVCFMVIMFFVFVLLMFTVCFYAQLFMENLVLYRRVEYDDTSESVRDASLLLNNKSNKKNKKRK